MKSLIFAAAALALTATSAQASCSKAGLNGLWTLEVAGTGLLVSINNGVFWFNSDRFTVNSFGSNCKGNGSLFDPGGPNTYPAKFAAEGGAAGTALRPNRLVAAFTMDGGLNYQIYVLTRK